MPMNNSARVFNRVFFAIVGVPVAALAIAGLGLNLEPLDGDMTRLGGYQERDFGWQGPIEGFRAVHTDFSRGYERPYDVLVLGDSFSHGECHGYWQNYFHQATGLSILTIHVSGSPPLEALVQSSAFRRSPPRLVVYEGAEHLLKFRLARPSHAVTLQEPPPATGVPLRPQALPTVQWSRLDGVPTVRLDLSLTQNYLLKTFRREVLGADETPVERLALTRSDLFTNRLSGEMLISHAMHEPASWTSADLALIRGRVRQMRALVEANGRTRFVFLPAPTKLTAYADWLAERQAPMRDPLAALTADPSLAIPPVEAALKRAIALGRRDVYMPNDLHWGPEGHRVAATALVDYLRATRFFRPSPASRPTRSSSAAAETIAPSRHERGS